MDEEKTKQPPESAGTRALIKRALVTKFSSVLALGASFLALSIGAYQARIMNVQTQLMQKQARAAVWPYISIGYSISDQGEKLGYTWQIDNDGVGPARIESVTMSLDGKPMHSWDEVFRAIFGNAAVPATYTQFDGKVIAPNTNRETTIDAMRILTLEQAKVFTRRKTASRWQSVTARSTTNAGSPIVRSRRCSLWIVVTPRARCNLKRRCKPSVRG
jgi:hypothetical protein